MKFFKNLKTIFRLAVCSVFILFIMQPNVNAQPAQPRPNILIVLTDDMSYKMIEKYSADTFVHTPNINRIGNEGAIFNCFSTNSLCVPGRTSLLTGNYGHRTGAMNNENYLGDSLITIPKILHNYGYFTAMIGKWMLGNSTHKPEFDYWLWMPNGTDYYNDTAVYFDTTLDVQGHVTDFITDSALQLISRIDTPFFCLLSFNAPHYPYIPQPQFDSLYDNLNFNLPLNWGFFNNNFPSFLYNSTNTIYSSINYQNTIKNYYELMKGVETSIGKVLDSLQANDLLENTMIVFTTDNGYLFGEHRLRGKKMPYTECIKLPLYIRYPQWFLPGTIVDSSIALNIDIAPTILEAAGINDTFNMDGTSLNNILTNQFIRHAFLYEQLPQVSDSAASLRSYRDNYFQYTRYYCIDTTEELFDLVTDSLQKINLVKHFIYRDTLLSYRLKLDSLRLALNDTVQLLSFDCYLANPLYTYPDLVVTISKTNSTCGLINGSINLIMENGGAPFNFIWNNGSTNNNLTNIMAGSYYVTITDANGSSTDLGIYLGNFASPVLSENHINPDYSNANGHINLFATGGAFPYTYLWNNGSTNQDLHNITAGDYSVTVTDSNNCQSSLSVALTAIYYDNSSTDTSINFIDMASVFVPAVLNNLFCNSKGISVFPNPANDFLTVYSESLNSECKVEIYNYIGQKISTSILNFSDKNENEISLAEWVSGFYIIKIVKNDFYYINSFYIVK